jgi:hypothetical protein
MSILDPQNSVPISIFVFELQIELIRSALLFSLTDEGITLALLISKGKIREERH